MKIHPFILSITQLPVLVKHRQSISGVWVRIGVATAGYIHSVYQAKSWFIAGIIFVVAVIAAAAVPAAIPYHKTIATGAGWSFSLQINERP